MPAQLACSDSKTFSTALMERRCLQRCDVIQGAIGKENCDVIQGVIGKESCDIIQGAIGKDSCTSYKERLVRGRSRGV
jgi:hypothetical protein